MMERERNGWDLKAERVRVGMTQTMLARRLGVSKRRVGTVENMIRPPEDFSRRYLAALTPGGQREEPGAP